MRLDLLLRDLPGISTVSDSYNQILITGISTDPELCRPGVLYVAAECETVDSTRYGVRLDGRDYIRPAVQNGAAAVLTTAGVAVPPEFVRKVALISHEFPLAILGPLCSRFFGEPRPKTIALVTGTNGKTSTVNFCRMLWASVNVPSCSVGNLGGLCSDGSIVWDRHPTLSVPETVALHEMLSTIARRGFDHVAMEATSHALYDYRLNGVAASIAAFTNLSRDHLDFHNTMEEYFRVKMTLFRDVLPPGSFAVLNADSPWFESAMAICKDRRHRTVSYGWKGSEIRLIKCADQPAGQALTLEVFGKSYQCELNLFGQFQVINALCSLGIVLSSGIPAEQAVDHLSSLTEVEGRLNIVAVTPSGGRVVVDYAHSPDGIRAALEACRSFTEGRLIIVFGCNGERDSGKRGEMGEMASNLADDVIITDGHPRSEDPGKIRREVAVGAPDAREIGDRASAIESGIRALGPGDTVLIAGMGHETFQVIGTKRLPFSDTETARRIVGMLDSKQDF